MRWSDRLWLLALLSVVAGLCCRRVNRPPIINFVEGDSLVSANDSAEYLCSAWDWELKPITFRWTASRGRFDSDTLARTMWYAPESSGTVQLLASAIDDSGLVTTESTRVRVRPDTATVVDAQGAVKHGGYRRWSGVYLPGYTILGDFEVDTNLVSFRILDDCNFGWWRDSQPYSPLFEMQMVDQDSFRAVVPDYGRYHLVLDNRHDNLDKSFRITARSISP